MKKVLRNGHYGDIEPRQVFLPMILVDAVSLLLYSVVAVHRWLTHAGGFGQEMLMLGAALLLSQSVFLDAFFFSTKERCYYVADLPYKRVYGWVLLILMFTIWPVFAVSGIRMWRHKRRILNLEK